MSKHGIGRQTSIVSLEASAEELRRRCEAVARFQGGSAHFVEQCAIFQTYIREKDILIGQPPAELSRPPDDEGNEHQVWFQSETGTYLKATWPDFFGMRVIHRHDEEPKASPIDYLERWLLHNQLFGDTVEFLGSLLSGGQTRLLIRQPAILGKPATEVQIEQFFSQEGWMPFRVDGELAFYDPENDVVISDTHRGNIILMEDGLLAPIDLRIERVHGALLDTVRQLCNSPNIASP